MSSLVKDRLYQTSGINLRYTFSPQGRYDDRGYGSVKLIHENESVAELVFGLDGQMAGSPREPKEDIDQAILVIARALATNQWLIIGEKLTYEHFETQEEPGVIGKFRKDAPRVYEDW